MIVREGSSWCGGVEGGGATPKGTKYSANAEVSVCFRSRNRVDVSDTYAPDLYIRNGAHPPLLKVVRLLSIDAKSTYGWSTMSCKPVWKIKHG
jgi:hypothetical protein